MKIHFIGILTYLRRYNIWSSLFLHQSLKLYRWLHVLIFVGEQSNSYDGRVIFVKLGDYTKRIGIDGSADAIKEAIKSAFRLRTKRAFWLEDEDNIVRSLDRDMPLGNYTLHVDEGKYHDSLSLISGQQNKKILFFKINSSFY